jgi:hypothetical protein
MDIGDDVTVKTDEVRRFIWTFQGVGVCRSCGADIWWVETHTGKKAPVDIPEGDGQATTSHFATCEQATQWRRK